MVSTAIKSLEGADLVYLMVEPGEYINKDYEELFKILRANPIKVFLVINKIDLYKKQRLNNQKNFLTKNFHLTKV